MAIYLGSQNVGIGVITKVGDNIKNEDITITENGVYNAGEGYTGLGTVTVDVEGSGGGEVIEVLNKTGAVINEGDKVWLSENTQVAGFLCNVGDYLLSNNYIRTGVLSRSGNFMVLNNKTYSIGTGTDGYTQIGNFEAIIGNIKYGPNQSIFSTYNGLSYRVDEGNQYKINYEYIGEDMFLGTGGVYYLDIDSGSQTQFRAYGFGSLSAEEIAINGMIYRLANYSGYYLKGIYDGSKWNFTNVNVTNLESLKPLGVTLDKKYIICGTSKSSFVGGTSKLRIVEIIDEDNMKVLTPTEMPADLQTYYSAYGMYTFNPYTGLLTACVNGRTDFVIMKYENGGWTKVAINYNSSNNFYGGITVSDDLSRLSTLNSSSGSSAFQRVYNLTSTEGYTAIPYKPYTVNEKTITATALTESQPNELTQVQIGSVTNEDLTITENGTYTPSATYTGFGSVNVNVKGAEKIEAVNKTGSSIAKGDKVWVNENYQGEVSSYQLGEATTSSTGGCIDRTGTFGVAIGKGYNIGDTQATYAYNVAGAYPRVLVYGDDNSILTCAGDGNRIYRIDGKAQFGLNPNSVRSFCSKYLYNDGSSISLKELNMATGETVKSWTLSYRAKSVVVIDNTAYAFQNGNTSSDKNYYFDLPEESGAITLSTQTSIANFTNAYLLPLGVTVDNKYIVMAKGTMGGTSLSGVTFFEVLGKGQLKELSSGELPTDLQPFYPATCYVAFNPYTGVLTAFSADIGYVIMKYENGTWTKLPIEINIPGGAQAPITLSDDLSKACTAYYLSGKYYSFIYNLPTPEGYSAIAYNTRNITENTITGYAMADAEPNETVTVSVPTEV